ncbi:MAG: molybdopterin cofactor-binding domain-containing protein [Nitrospinota bacterium]
MSSELRLNPRWFGASVPRTEDGRLLTGGGRYVDDLPCPNALHAAFLRSPYAHARIESVDTSGALDLGAVAAFTAEDLGPACKEFPQAVPNPALRPRNVLPLARGVARYVGEPIAIALAESRAAAEDALEGIQISYEVRPAVAHPVDALGKGAPLVHEDLQDNRAARLEVRFGDVEKALARAARRETLRLTLQRAGGEAMETRGLLAFYDSAFDQLTVYSSTQVPHQVRRNIAYVLDRAEHSVDVIAPDVGGGFGAKAFSYAEDFVIPWAAMHAGRPVKWIEDRIEHIQTTYQEREQVHEVEVGFDDEGHLLAIRDRGVFDTGAYVPWGVVVPYLTITNIPGPYRIQNFDAILDVAYTHRVPITPIRGAGRPQSAFIMERIIERVATRLGLDPAEVRRRNLVQPDEFPYEVGIRARDGTMMTYDSGDYPGLLEMALEAAGYEDFREGKRQPGEQGDPQKGRYVGVGMSFNIEGTGFGPYEGAVVRVDPSGKVVLYTGATPTGQGHETVLAQVLGSTLNLAPQRIKVVTGDTRHIPYGMGTFASRIAVMASNSVAVAGESLKRKIFERAASHLECSVEDLELSDGTAFVRGAPDRAVTLGELAKKAAGVPGIMMKGEIPGLEVREYSTLSHPATASGCHVCIVEADVHTGFVKVLRYVVAHDCGRILNPTILTGQVRGAVVHGIGETLIEEVVFDENATPLASSFLDYLLPLSTDVPDIEVLHLETPSPFNALGVKGAGESGTIAAPAAVAAAIEDALKPLGILINETPLTPYRLWQIMGTRNSPVDYRQLD